METQTQPETSTEVALLVTGTLPEISGNFEACNCCEYDCQCKKEMGENDVEPQ